ncbi:hypothetical protein REH70_17415 [Cellulomonas sp. ATA003]|nr:hypothetical protein [Cellulomonas sp. ATA003]WNB85355.1 hypothetical protein REH70_17415 [Cellulomonas sp. ATA003]
MEALAALAGMDRDAVAAQATSAVDAVVHLRRSDTRRVLAEIGVVQRAPSGQVEVVTALRRSPGDGDRDAEGEDAEGGGAEGVVPGPGWPALERRLTGGGGGG